MKLYSSGHKKFTTIVSTAQRNSVKNKTPSIASFLLLLYSHYIAPRVKPGVFKQSKQAEAGGACPCPEHCQRTYDYRLATLTVGDWIKTQGSTTEQWWWWCGDSTRAQAAVVKPLYLWPPPPPLGRTLITRARRQTDLPCTECGGKQTSLACFPPTHLRGRDLEFSADEVAFRGNTRGESREELPKMRF